MVDFSRGTNVHLPEDADFAAPPQRLCPRISPGNADRSHIYIRDAAYGSPTLVSSSNSLQIAVSAKPK